MVSSSVNEYATEALKQHVPEALLTPTSFQTLFYKPRFLTAAPVTAHAPLLFWLASVVRSQETVVLGCDDGMAHFALCQAMDAIHVRGRCHGFGFWSNSGPDRRVSPVPEQLRTHAETLYDGVSQLVAVESVVAALERFGSETIDLLFVDLANLPQNSAFSGEAILDRLTTGGVLVLHGTNEIANGGPAYRQVERLLSTMKHAVFPFGDGMMVAGQDDKVPPPVQSLFDLAPGGVLRSDIELIFRRSGQGMLALAEAAHQEEARHHYEKEAAGARAELEQAQALLDPLQISYKNRNIKLSQVQSEVFDLKRVVDALIKERKARSLQTVELTQNADGLRQQIMALQGECVELRQARDAAIAAKESQTTDLGARLQQERDTRFSETAELTKIADSLREQILTLQGECTELREARDTAITAAELQRIDLSARLPQERDSRFSETTALTRMAEGLREQISALQGECTELRQARDAAITAAELQKTDLSARLDKERDTRFAETATLTKIAESLRKTIDQTVVKKRKFEQWMIARFVKSEQKLNKYKTNRVAYFSDGKSRIGHIYLKIRPGQ